MASWVCRPAAHGARAREPRVPALSHTRQGRRLVRLLAKTKLTLSFSLDPERRLGRCKNTTEPHRFCTDRKAGGIIGFDRQGAQRARTKGRLEACARNLGQEAVDGLLPLHAQNRFVVAAQ